MLRIKRGRPIFMLVGNKADKGYEREVSKEEGASLARSFGCDFLETSAKTAQNVDKLFTDLVRLLRMTREQDPQSKSSSSRPGEEKTKEKKLKLCVIC